MVREKMASPAKRRPAPTPGPRGSNTNGPRSPPRLPRPSPTNTRTGGSGTSSSSTFIAPPPRAALSGTSSPAPDNPRNNNTNNSNNNNNNNNNNNHPTPTAFTSPRLAPNTSGSRPGSIARRSRSPSPFPAGGSTATPPATTTTTAATTAPGGAAPHRREQERDKERDARVAALEHELALMEAEFLCELDKLSRAESETAAFWQGKCAALEREVGLLRRGQQREPQREPQQAVGLQLEGRGHDYDQGYEGGRVGSWGMERRSVVTTDGDGNGSWDGDVDVDVDRGEEEQEQEERVRAAWRMVEKKEDEIAELKAQVRGLKEWVSVSTRADGQAQTSDEVFGEGMARLGNGLQNWVLVNFRRATVDLSGVHEDTISEVARLVPMYEELVSASRIHLLQSIVSRLLVELVFDPCFVGLPADVAGQLKQVEAFLSSVNQWRSLTLTMIKKDASERLQTETSAVIDAVMCKVNTLLDPLTNTRSSESRDQGLQALIASAIDLSRLLAVQKAVFKIEMPEILPHQRIMFDAETMEDIGVEEEDSLAGREICCVTFPGIIKRGDESGGHLQYRNVIAKAKVLCSPE